MANPTLRKALEAGKTVVAPAAYDAVTARLMQYLGFEAVSVAGGQTSFALCTPEPLLNVNDLADVSERVVKATHGELPVTTDVTNGFGGPVQVMHTVEVMEAAGVTAIHIEDQTFPAPVAYTRGAEELCSIEDYQQRIEYAVKAKRSKDFLIIARIDEQKVGNPPQAAVKRAHAALEARADVIMPIFPKSVEDMHYLRKNIKDVPLCTGLHPPFEISDYESAGWQLILHPTMALQVGMLAMYKAYKHVKDTGKFPPGFIEAQKELRALGLMGKLMDLDAKLKVEEATLKPSARASR